MAEQSSCRVKDEPGDIQSLNATWQAEGLICAGSWMLRQTDAVSLSQARTARRPDCWQDSSVTGLHTDVPGNSTSNWGAVGKEARVPWLDRELSRICLWRMCQSFRSSVQHAALPPTHKAEKYAIHYNATTPLTRVMKHEANLLSCQGTNHWG